MDWITPNTLQNETLGLANIHNKQWSGAHGRAPFLYGRAVRYLGQAPTFEQISESGSGLERLLCWRESGTETLF
jgi:hypothetical protein